MMVDKACGFDANAPEHLGVHLLCPICKTIKRTTRDRSWPNGTHCCECPCPAHQREGYEIKFFDRDGKELFIR